MDTDIVYIPISELRPHEETKEKKLGHYVRLVSRMARTRLKVKPLWVDRETKVILDGHHRYSMFREIGCRRVPCILVDYLADPSIQVLPRRTDTPVSKQIVIDMALSGNTFPPKTTKHVFPCEAPEFYLNLKKCMEETA